MSLPRVLAILLTVAVSGMAIHSDRRDVHPSIIRLSAPAYGGPTVDDLTDQLDATRTASRIAQEAAEAAEAARVAEEAQRTVQRPSQLSPATIASDDWWYRIAVCETGHNPPTNEWRTGYFGLEGGKVYGGYTWDEQLTIAKGILATYGKSAWGCAPVADAGG